MPSRTSRCFWPDGRERDRLAPVVVVNQIHPVRADVAERVALLDPLEGAGRDVQRLLQVGRAVERRADALLDLLANAQVVGVVALVHVHRHDAVLRARQLDDPVGLGDIAGTSASR